MSFNTILNTRLSPFYTLLFLLSLKILMSGGQITVHPHDTWAFENETVKLECCTNTVRLRWMVEDKMLHNGDNLLRVYKEKGYAVINDTKPNGNRCLHLVNHNIQLEYSGTYTCKSYDEDTKAQLVVLDRRPVCDITTDVDYLYLGEESNITLQCSVEYSGNLDPVFKWKENGDAFTDVTNYTKETDIKSKKILVSLLNVTRNHPSTFKSFLFVNGIPQQFDKPQWTFKTPFKIRTEPNNDTGHKSSQMEKFIIHISIIILLSILVVVLVIFIILQWKKQNTKLCGSQTKGVGPQPENAATLMGNYSDKSDKPGSEMPT